eukprot:c21929_g2_i1.p1 GENE.c21929_g2_i1~~c21929_g2_i1.p1  ORF type:complete len:546 (+),score=191.20 c21929_g2_i1:25-1638(+)
MTEKKRDLADRKNFRTVIGWTSSLFTRKNTDFLELLESVLDQIGVDPSERVMNDDGALIQSVAERLANESSFTENIEKFLSSGIKNMLISRAKKLFEEEKVKAEGDSKFTMDASLGNVSSFFGGLSKLIGDPHPSLFEAVRKEHCEAPDSQEKFTTFNYHIETTPEDEWRFVFDSANSPDLLLTRGRKANGESLGSRDKLTPQELKAKALERMREISGLEVSPEEFEEINLSEEEIGCLRLYTGPMFKKYNDLLRKLGKESVQKLDSKAATDETKQKSAFCTTIHLISSGLIKLSKIQPAFTLYRGISKLKFPERFWKADKYNVKGGVEFGFTSCTTNREVALEYSSGYLFELSTGMVTRGASISWLSFYPEEREVCLPPCTALEVTDHSRFEGKNVIVEMNIITNPAAATIDDLLGVRKRVLVELGGVLNNQLQIKIDNDNIGREDDMGGSTASSLVVMKAYIDELKRTNHMKYNEDGEFKILMKSMIDLQHALMESDNLEFALYQAMKAKAPQAIQILCDNDADIMGVVVRDFCF